MAKYVVIEWDDCEDFEIILATDDLEQARVQFHKSDNPREVRAVEGRPFFRSTESGIEPTDRVGFNDGTSWDMESALFRWAEFWIQEDNRARTKAAHKQALAEGYLLDYRLTYADPNWKPMPAPTSCITWFPGVAPQLPYDKETLRAFFPTSPDAAFSLGALERRVAAIMRSMKKPYREVPDEIKKQVAELISAKP